MKLLKVILADDEEIIRDGIHGSIDWESLGFEVVGQAEDGEQAIEIVEQTDPDIIITDIRMPFINGLEFIQAIRSKHDKAYIIIISGHDEFKYAQKALKLGVYDYILKPLDIDYLEKLLLKIKHEIEVDSNKENEINVLKEKASRNMPLLKEKFLKDIIYERIEWNKNSNKYEHLDFSHNIFAVTMIAQIDDYYVVTKDMSESDKKLLDKAFCSAIKGTEEKFSGMAAIEVSKQEYIVCTVNERKEMLKKNIIDICSEIRKRMVDIYGSHNEYTLTIGIGNIYETVHDLNKSYKEASEGLVNKFILGSGRNIYFEKVKGEVKRNQNDVNFVDGEMISAIKLLNKQLIDNRIKAIMSNMNTRSFESGQYIKIMVTNVFIQTLKIVKELSGVIEEIFDDPIEIYNKIMVHETMEGMIKELKEFLFKVIDYLNIKKGGKFRLAIEKAKEYIYQNYSDKDCSLESVSRFVNISSCYFSVIFKQEVGETFIDFITRIRIEKAKELLNLSGYKTYEISYLVGYNNPTYFSTTFKKYTGYSPSEYRQSREGQGS
jgi:two-component system, response regulator YesN